MFHAHLHIQVSMLEAKNARMNRELENLEASRSSAMRLRDILLEERDSLAEQLKAAQQQLQVGAGSCW